MLQKGGLEPLTRVPNFKYTFNEKRKIFIGYIYPYAEHFIGCVTSIPFNSYTYNGNCEYIDRTKTQQKVSPCNSINSPLYLFKGGAVYELLNKKFNNVNLHNYCDATGDIDVSLYPPKLTSSDMIDDDYYVYSLNKDGKINSFYSDFTRWTFENMVKNVQSIEVLFRNMKNLVDFNIDEYDDIPTEYKSTDFGYNVQMIGKLYVVAYFDDGEFRIQVVCKIEDSGVSVIDHIIEIMIPLPEKDDEFIPTDDGNKPLYKQPNFNTITINEKSFNIQAYESLIRDNFLAYNSRKSAYGKPNEREYIYQPINHIARLFYLYELIYQNQSSIQFTKIYSLLYFAFYKQEKIDQFKFLRYYKIIDGNFYPIKVDTRFFFNSYLELISKMTYSYNLVKNIYPDFFINYTDINDIKTLHTRFVTGLFNDDLFQPSGMLTFRETAGGKKSKKTRKLRKNHKKRNTKNKKNKALKGKTVKKVIKTQYDKTNKLSF